MRFPRTNLEWTEIGSFTAADLVAEGSSYTYTCNGNGQPAKYVRMRLTQDSSQWLQLFEFEVNKGEELGGAIPVAVTNDGQDAGVVCDRTVSTTFTATDAGYVEYQLIHGQKVDEITVLFQGTESEAEKPAVEIQTDGEWVKVGELNENPAKFDVSAYTNVTAVKVSWNAENIPTIMEIMEKGDAYAERTAYPCMRRSRQRKASRRTTSPRTSGQPFRKRSQRQRRSSTAKARRNPSMQRTPL